MTTTRPLSVLMIVALVGAACTNGDDDSTTVSAADTTLGAVPTEANNGATTGTAASSTTPPSRRDPSTTQSVTTRPAPTTAAPAPTTTQPPRARAKLKPKTFRYREIRSDPQTRLRVRPTVVQGRPADLSNYQLDATSATLVPWYVHVRVKSLGGGALESPSFTTRLSAVNGGGDTLDNLFIAGLNTCQSDTGVRRLNRQSPAMHECQVFMVPRGQRLAAVTLRNQPSQGGVRWQVPQKIAGNQKPRQPGKGGPPGERNVNGQGKNVNWNRGNVRFSANIRPVSVIKGRKADLSTFDLGASDKLATPWYVTFATRHVGQTPTRNVPEVGTATVAYNGRDQKVKGVILIGRFPKCQDAPPPNRFGPNSKPIRTCAVFLVPDGQEITTVGMAHNNSDEVTWQVRRGRG